MKKAIIGFAAFAALAATSVSAMSLADASAKVGEAAKDPKTMSPVWERSYSTACHHT